MRKLSRCASQARLALGVAGVVERWVRCEVREGKSKGSRQSFERGRERARGPECDCVLAEGNSTHAQRVCASDVLRGFGHARRCLSVAHRTDRVDSLGLELIDMGTFRVRCRSST